MRKKALGMVTCICSLVHMTVSLSSIWGGKSLFSTVTGVHIHYSYICPGFICLANVTYIFVELVTANKTSKLLFFFKLSNLGLDMIVTGEGSVHDLHLTPLFNFHYIK